MIPRMTVRFDIIMSDDLSRNSYAAVEESAAAPDHNPATPRHGPVNQPVRHRDPG
jgi:hypothetical protein